MRYRKLLSWVLVTILLANHALTAFAFYDRGVENGSRRRPPPVAAQAAASDPATTTLTLQVTFQAVTHLPAGLQVQVVLSGPNGVTAHTPSLDANGRLTLGSLPIGTYDVWVKFPRHLANRVNGITLDDTTGVIDLGMLRAGDANDDNAVTGADFSLLAATYLRAKGDADYDPRADFNFDDVVTGADFSLLATNYLQAGAPRPKPKVPDVVGLSQAEALAAITAAGLTAGQVTFEHSDAVQVVRVIRQKPTGGTEVEPGSTVDLVISLGPAPVRVPDVVGLPQADAETTITSAGFPLGRVSTAASETVPAGSVSGQVPRGGAEVLPGTPVDLVVASGPPNNPPQITSAPVITATVGQPYTYTVTATDPDAGDVLTFSLPLAPAGMAIDPASGLIQWTPDAAQVVQHDVTVRVQDAGGLFDLQTFIVAVRAANEAPVALDDAYTARFGETLTVAAAGVLDNDTDPNGDPLAVALVDPPTRGTVTLRPDGSFDYTPNGGSRVFDPVSKWRFSSPTQCISGQITGNAGAVADLDGDGVPEVLVDAGLGCGAGSNQFKAVRGVTGEEVFISPPSTGTDFWIRAEHRLSRPAVGDIDGDGRPEIVYSHICELHVVAFEHDGTLKFTTLPPGVPRDRGIIVCPEGIGGGSTPHPVLADLDGDGKAEIIKGGQGGESGGSPSVRVFDSAGNKVWHLDVPFMNNGTFEPNPVVADVDLDGKPEIIFGDALISHDGKLIWRNDVARTGSSAAVNLDDDPEAEIVRSAGSLYVFEHDGTLKWYRSCIPDCLHFFWDPPYVTDFDGDGEPEIGVNGQGPAESFGAFLVFEKDGTLKWRTELFVGGDRVIASSAAVFDFDGDGIPTVVVATTKGLLFLRGDDGSVIREIPDGGPTGGGGAFVPPPLVVDVDADGHAELVASFEAPGARWVEVFEGRDDDWTRTRPIWNQASYHVTNVNADGTIPAREPINWLTPWLNNAYVNALLPEEGVPYQDAFTYRANDGALDSNLATVHLEVLPPNGPPRILSRPDTTATVGFEYRYAPIAVDPDPGDTLTFAFTARPPGMTIDPATGLIRWTPGPVKLVHRNLIEHVGLSAINASSHFDDGINAYPPERAVDGDLNTSWFTAPGDAASLGASPFYEVVFSQDVTVSEIQMSGNRQFADGFDFLAGIFELFDGGGNLLFSSGEVDLPAPNRDLTIAVPDVTSVRRVRFTVTKDETDHNGFAELRVIGPVAAPGGGGAGYEVEVGLTVTDSQGESAFQGYTLVVGAPVTVPDVVGRPRADAEAALAAAHLAVERVAERHDPAAAAGTVIAQSPPAGAVAEFGQAVDLTLSLGPGPGDTDGDGDGFTPNQGDCDDIDPSIFPGAADPEGDGIDQNCDGADGVLVLAQIIVEPSNPVLLTGQSVQLTATGVFTDGRSQGLTDLATWASSDPAVASISTGSVVVRGEAPGVATIRATRNGITGTTKVTVVERAAGDTTPPVAEITSPEDGATVTAPVAITGTASDDNFLKYVLEFAPAGETDFTPIVESTTPVVDGVLGTFDPTLLLNGSYEIRLRVFDRGGNSLTTQVTYIVAEEMKVGFSSLSFLDVSLPVGGDVPIQVVRVYDSRDKRQRDFGIGWRIDITSFKLEKNRPEGLGWDLIQQGFRFQLQPDGPHLVAVTLPSGKVERFAFTPTPNSSVIVPLQATFPSYTPLPGTRSRLEPLGDKDLLVGGGAIFDFNGAPYDPKRYLLTQPNGIKVVLNIETGVEQIIDRKGNTLTFSADGVTHSGGRSLSFTRDAEGRITEITDPRGNTRRYEYDARGDLVASVDFAGNRTTYTYDFRHNLLEVVTPGGVMAARNEYDGQGRLIAQIDARGAVTRFEHDIDARRETVIDRLGNRTTMEYDENGRLIRVIDPMGNESTAQYDSQGRLISSTDPLGNTTTLTYDANGFLKTVQDPTGVTYTLNIDSEGKLLSVTDAIGRSESYDYDAAGNLISYTERGGGTIFYDRDALGFVWRIRGIEGRFAERHFNALGNLERIIDHTGREIVQTFDANGNPTRTILTYNGKTVTYEHTYDELNRWVSTTVVRGAGTSTERVERNADGRVTARVDALGDRTSFEYDPSGNLVRIVHPDGTTEFMEYDAEDRLIAKTDREGRRTTFTHDALGRVIRTDYPDGTFETVTYDVAGRVISMSDRRGNVFGIEYDAAGRVLREVDGDGNVTEREYDAVGRVILERDPAARELRFEYDVHDRITRIIFPDGTARVEEFDAVGRRTRLIDRLGHSTEFEYDPAGNLTAVIDALGQRTDYTYDSVGRLTSQTDPLGRTTRFEYDEFGQLRRRILPLGMVEERAYNTAGRLISVKDFNGRETTFTYDPILEMLTSINYPDGRTETFTYSPEGNLLSVTDSRGVTSFEYDAQDRMVRERQPDGTELVYTYDGDGRVTSVTTPDGTTTYAYDARGHLREVVDPDGGRTTFEYDALDQLTRVTRPNGVRTDYTYDVMRALIRIEHRDAAGNLLASYNYERDAGGRITRVTESNGRTVEYEYDALDRLVRETETVPPDPPRVTSYTYDAVGNRITQTDASGTRTYTYDDNDRLLDDGVFTYTYDLNGNRLSRSGPGGTDIYEYDSRDRLTRFILAAGGSTTYSYDSWGNLIARSAPGGTVHYLVDRFNPTGFAQVVRETDGSGNLIANYVYGASLLSRATGAARLFVLGDARESVRQLVDAGGAVVDEFAYDAFGQRRRILGSTPIAHGFNAELHDPETGLQYLRARYYEPGVGRFLTADTLLGAPFQPPTLNLYVYSLNDPVNRSDPSGNTSLLDITLANSIRTTLAGIQESVGYTGIMLAEGAAAGHTADQVFKEWLVAMAFNVGLVFGVPLAARAFNRATNAFRKRLRLLPASKEATRVHVGNMRRFFSGHDWSKENIVWEFATATQGRDFLSNLAIKVHNFLERTHHGPSKTLKELIEKIYDIVFARLEKVRNPLMPSPRSSLADLHVGGNVINEIGGEVFEDFVNQILNGRVPAVSKELGRALPPKTLEQIVRQWVQTAVRDAEWLDEITRGFSQTNRFAPKDPFVPTAVNFSPTQFLWVGRAFWGVNLATGAPLSDPPPAP